MFFFLLKGQLFLWEFLDILTFLLNTPPTPPVDYLRIIVLVFLGDNL